MARALSQCKYALWCNSHYKDKMVVRLVFLKGQSMYRGDGIFILRQPSWISEVVIIPILIWLVATQVIMMTIMSTKSTSLQQSIFIDVERALKIYSYRVEVLMFYPCFTLRLVSTLAMPVASILCRTLWLRTSCIWRGKGPLSLGGSTSRYPVRDWCGVAASRTWLRVRLDTALNSVEFNPF